MLEKTNSNIGRKTIPGKINFHCFIIKCDLQAEKTALMPELFVVFTAEYFCDDIAEKISRIPSFINSV